MVSLVNRGPSSRCGPPSIYFTYPPLLEIDASPMVPATSAASILATKSPPGTISLSTVTCGCVSLSCAPASFRPTSSGAHHVVKRSVIGDFEAPGLAAGATSGLAAAAGAAGSAGLAAAGAAV